MENSAGAFWANPNNPLCLAYHDEEWGKPCHDERMLLYVTSRKQ